MAGIELGDTQDPRQASVQAPVKAMQHFLQNRGYNITVDGVRGPETNAAVLAFHKKVPPASFNASRKGAVPDVASAQTDSSSSGASTAVVPKGKGGGGRPGKPTVPAIDPATGQVIDPAAYAKGLTDAEYNPQINEILRQLTQGRSDQSSHTKQIQDWFSQALGVQSDMAKADAAAGQDAEQGYNAENANVLNLFGGPNSYRSTASEAAAFHDIGLSNLTADVNAQGQFDKNLRSIEALKGTEAQTGQFNADQQALKDLAGKLVDLRGAKGSAYGAAYQTGVQNRTQQEAAQQQLALAKALAPSQIKAANANATTAVVNAKSAAANNATNLAIAKARLAQANAATKAALAANGGKWNLELPQQQGAFQKALETNVFGPKGGLAINPETAWANLQQQLKMNGLAGDSHAQQLAQGVFLQGLWTSHSLGNFGGFAWDGKKIVRTGNKYTVDKKTGKRVLTNSKGKAIPDYKPKR
jgi:hypothetical protein